MTDNAGYRPTDDSALRWEDCHCTKCGQPDKKCECVALTPGTKVIPTSNGNHERWLAETWRMIEDCAKDNSEGHRVSLSAKGCAALLAERRSIETLPVDCKDCEQLIGERDRAQDALQTAHIALGGDGEWVGRLPPCPAPESGDLHLDVPELAALIKQERDAAFEALGWCLGCNNSREACELQWSLQRKCCPDCTHVKPPSEKASESHGPVLTRVCPGCNTVHSGPLCPTESE